MVQMSAPEDSKEGKRPTTLSAPEDLDKCPTTQMIANHMVSWLCLDELTLEEYKLPKTGVFDIDRGSHLLPEDQLYVRGTRRIEVFFNGVVVRRFWVVGYRGDDGAGCYFIMQELAEKEWHHYYGHIQLSKTFQPHTEFLSFSEFVDCRQYQKKNLKTDYIEIKFSHSNAPPVLILSSNHGNPAEQSDAPPVLVLSSNHGNPAMQMMQDLDLPIPLSDKEKASLLRHLQHLEGMVLFPKVLQLVVVGYVPGSIPHSSDYGPGWSGHRPELDESWRVPGSAPLLHPSHETTDELFSLFD